MKRWTKFGALAAAMAVSAGVGFGTSAFAGDDPAAQPPTAAADAAPKADTKALLGGGNNEDLFVPITPCRIVDTREAGGKLTVGGSRVFDVAGSGATFAAQGGKAGGCGIANGATAIEATITAVDSGSGFLRAWPANAAAPNATFLNYTDMLNVSNTGTVAINGCTGICLVNTDLRLRAFGTDTHVVVDVNGYYVRQMSAEISGTGALVNGNRVSSATKLSTGQYEVVFDRDISTCSFQATPVNGAGAEAVVDNRFANANGVFVKVTDSAGTTADRGFFVSVTC